MSKMCTNVCYHTIIKWCHLSLSGPPLSFLSSDTLSILHTLTQLNVNIILLCKVFQDLEMLSIICFAHAWMGCALWNPIPFISFPPF